MALTESQKRVILHNQGNILVSASAGSGKTHTMIERVKRLVIEEDVSVNQILAVTFTEAAAADMKEKLKKALSKVICEADKDCVGQEKARKCENQLSEIDTADISTMHAFCARIIRTYFFVCGLAPDFKILDESDAKIIKNKAIETTFKEFYDSNEEWFLTLVDRHAQGRLDKNLKELVAKIYDFCDSEAHPLDFANKFKSVYTKESFDSLLSQFKGALDQIILPYKGDLEQVVDSLDEFEVPKAYECANRIYNAVTFFLNNDCFKIAKENFSLGIGQSLRKATPDQNAIIKAAKEKLESCIEKITNVIKDNYEIELKNFLSCATHSEYVVKVLERYGDNYAALKREENALDFNDLEHFALEILSNSDANKEITDKYKYIFIDEFQDTNGVQNEIVKKIDKNNVFMVGDVKQSIYGFRGCRSKFFSEKEKESELSSQGMQTERLNENFRSAKKVIEFVNAVFNYCMTERFYGENYKNRSELNEGGIYPSEREGRAALHWLVKEKETADPEEPRIYDVITEENVEKSGDGAKVSALVAKIVFEECGKEFYDVKNKCMRPVEFGDIVVLTRNRNGDFVKDLIKGLRAYGIRVTSDSSENVCDYPETQIMLNALKLVDNFLQDLPLVSTLKSPLGGFSEEELFEIARFYRDNEGKGGFTQAFNTYLQLADTPLKDKLKEFKEYFDQVRLLADFIGAGGVMEKLINDKSFEAHLYAQRDGADKVERLKRFVEASVVGNKTLTVKEFISRAENCPEAFELSLTSSGNTVRVMTIHSSKGLEFPVVIACGLERHFNKDEDSAEIMFDREYGFAVKYYDDIKRTREETLLRAVLREKFKRQRIQEEMRLFYVALTRAVYSLHAVFYASEDIRKKDFAEAETYASFIPQELEVLTYTSAELAQQTRAALPRKVIIGKPDQDMVEQIKSDISFSYPFESDVRLPLKGSVTELSSADDDAVFTHVLFEEESPDKERGVIAHKVLELFDFDSDKSVYEQVESLIENKVLTREEVSKINLDRINFALGSVALKALKGKKLYREQSFLFNISACEIFATDSKTPVLVQGVIDLLAISDEGACIIDYKYSSLDKKSLRLKYQKQLDLYASAVQNVLGKKIIGKTLVNIFTGDVVDLD